jgi:hypothetical protein
MPDDDTGRNLTDGYAPFCSTENESAEQTLFAIAQRFRMPLERLPDDTVYSLADRLSLALEHHIALLLLALEEIATLEERPS